jgi:hypothetical protein
MGMRPSRVLYAGSFMSLQALVTRAVVLSIVSTYAAGQNASSALQEELIAADRGIWQAISGPRPQMDRVSAALAPDYLDIDSGVRHSRDEVFEYLRNLTNFSFDYASARAYVLSPTSGYVTAEVSYSSTEGGKAASGKVLTVTVFANEKGHWMAHLHIEMEPGKG